MSTARVTILYDSFSRKDYSVRPAVCENKKGASDRKSWGHENRIVNVIKSRFFLKKKVIFPYVLLSRYVLGLCHAVRGEKSYSKLYLL